MKMFVKEWMEYPFNPIPIASTAIAKESIFCKAIANAQCEGSLRHTASAFIFSRCYRNIICLLFEFLYSVASFKIEYILFKIKVRLSKIDTIFTFSCTVEATLLHFI